MQSSRLEGLGDVSRFLDWSHWMRQLLNCSALAWLCSSLDPSAFARLPRCCRPLFAGGRAKQ